jgi:hypothetical protein
MYGSSEQFSFRRHFLSRHPALFYEVIFFASFFSLYLLHLHSRHKGKCRAWKYNAGLPLVWFKPAAPQSSGF